MFSLDRHRLSRGIADTSKVPYTNEAGDGDREGFIPRWYQRLAFAALGVGIILWNALKLYRAN